MNMILFNGWLFMYLYAPSGQGLCLLESPWQQSGGLAFRLEWQLCAACAAVSNRATELIVKFIHHNLLVTTDDYRNASSICANMYLCPLCLYFDWSIWCIECTQMLATIIVEALRHTLYSQESRRWILGETVGADKDSTEQKRWGNRN